jgi:hypothetical protein
MWSMSYIFSAVRSTTSVSFGMFAPPASYRQIQQQMGHTCSARKALPC